MKADCSLILPYTEKSTPESATKDGMPLIKNGKKNGKPTDFYAFAYTCIQMDANDTDNDNVNVNDNDNVNEYDNERRL